VVRDEAEVTGVEDGVAGLARPTRKLSVVAEAGARGGAAWRARHGRRRVEAGAVLLRRTPARTRAVLAASLRAAVEGWRDRGALRGRKKEE
jgi:hypothetical protein